MSKTTVRYQDVSPGAAQDATVVTQDAVSFSDPSLIPISSPPQPVISLERNAWALDGTYVARDTQTLAFWSLAMCGRDCVFADRPEITVTTSQQYSGVGLSFDFGGDSWPTSMTVKWYQGDALLQETDFQPDGISYFCEQQVTAFDKIVLTFTKMSLPVQRLKINKMYFGLIREFGMGEMRNAVITSETGLISQEIPVSTFDWVLDAKTDVEYMFQLKQPVEVINGNALIGVFYVDSFSRKGQYLYDLSCYDAIGVLSETNFDGAVYTNKSAKAMLEEIIGDEFTVEYDDSVADTILTGAILPGGTKRDAMQQCLFAWGVCAQTVATDKVLVFSLPSSPEAIGRDKAYTGATVDTAAIVTKVIVTSHTYTQDQNGGIEIDGVMYKDTTSVYTVDNPDVTATDKQNVVEVTDATLVSEAIGQVTAQRVYDYYTRRNTAKVKTVWDGNRVGDCVTVPNAWGGTNTGNISRMQITLSNTVAAEMEVVGT